jgi:WD40 repeat protein
MYINVYMFVCIYIYIVFFLPTSGDVAEAPTIRIWHSKTLETLAVLQGFHRRGICHLKFSSNNKHLASVGMYRYL